MNTFIFIRSGRRAVHQWWRICTLDDTDNWRIVAAHNSNVINQRYTSRPLIVEQDGDFEGKANSLEEFIEHNIEKFF